MTIMSSAPDGSPSDRAEGYVTEIGYAFVYYDLTNPLSMRLPLLAAGIRPPRIETACELGFGQGVGIALHAAAGSARWLGNDINPEHVDHACGLLQASGVSADLCTDSFAELLARQDIPPFDLIVMHGVWSWVSDRNRQRVVDFVDRHLKPGGVFYVSYNAEPGWTGLAPVRHLIIQHAALLAGQKGIVERIDDSIAFVTRLFETKPEYLAEHPKLEMALGELRTADRRYLAHEYFNRDWRAMHFAEMQAMLAPAGLTYACRAGHETTLHNLLMTPDQRALLQEVKDPVSRETVRDFLLNQTFRADYWVKMPVAAGAGQLPDFWLEERVVRVSTESEVPFAIRAPLMLHGHGALASACTDVLDLLQGGTPRSIADIAGALANRVPMQIVVEAVAILIDRHFVAPAQSAAETEAARQSTARLNRHILEQAASGGEIRHLASPVLGGGFPVGLLDQLFLRAWQSGETSQDAWVRIVQTVLRQLEGLKKPIAIPNDLRTEAAAFAETRLPLLRSLQIA